MAEEKLYPVDPSQFMMDDATWEALQRGKEITRAINLPLDEKEVVVVQGPTDLNALDEPDFKKKSTEPNAIAANQEEFNEMRAAYEMGQTLEAMTLGGKGEGWQDLRHIAAEKIKELRLNQDTYDGVERDKIVDLALKLRHYKEAYDFLFNMVKELIALPKPVLKIEEKYPR